MTDLRKFTREHAKMKCYGLGLGLDSFRMVALMENFRKLDAAVLLSAYQRRAPLCLHASLQPCGRLHASL